MEITANESKKRASKEAEAWLQFFMFPVRAREFLALSGAQADDPLLVAIQNYEEDFQGHIESSALDLLAALRRRDASFLSDDRRYIDFIFFLFLQFFRTAKWPETISSELRSFPGIRFERVWNVLRYIFASNAGRVIFRERKDWRLKFLESCSTTSFITGDQPVFNVVPRVEYRGAAPTELKLYYPVSPKLAVLLSKESGFQNGAVVSLSKTETDDYNQLVLANSHLQVYGVSRHVLSDLERR